MSVGWKNKALQKNESTINLLLMMMCPNSSHSAGLNAFKSRATVNNKIQSIKLSSFHSGLFSMPYGPKMVS
jgi:hypothetical protein